MASPLQNPKRPCAPPKLLCTCQRQCVGSLVDQGKRWRNLMATPHMTQFRLCFRNRLSFDLNNHPTLLSIEPMVQRDNARTYVWLWGLDFVALSLQMLSNFDCLSQDLSIPHRATSSRRLQVVLTQGPDIVCAPTDEYSQPVPPKTDMFLHSTQYTFNLQKRLCIKRPEARRRQTHFATLLTTSVR